MKKDEEFKDITVDDERVINEALWQIEEWISADNHHLSMYVFVIYNLKLSK